MRKRIMYYTKVLLCCKGGIRCDTTAGKIVDTCIMNKMLRLFSGIGVDDMFLLLAGLSETYETLNCEKHPWTVEDRIKHTMRSSGVGITITSITDLIAFLAGITSTFLGVRNFCIYTGKIIKTNSKEVLVLSSTVVPYLLWY